MVFQAEASGGSKAGGLPTLTFPFPSPPLSIPPTFQTNQWEGRSDPVRGEFPGFPLTNTTLCVCRIFVCAITDLLFVAGYRSDNFVVGLTNDSSNPVLWDYTVCGQYPGSVPDGATVSLQCTNVCERALRFINVIVQFPLINDQMNFCELEVYALGMILLCPAPR